MSSKVPRLDTKGANLIKDAATVLHLEKRGSKLRVKRARARAHQIRNEPATNLLTLCQFHGRRLVRSPQPALQGVQPGAEGGAYPSAPRRLFLPKNSKSRTLFRCVIGVELLLPER